MQSSLLVNLGMLVAKANIQPFIGLYTQLCSEPAHVSN